MKKKTDTSFDQDMKTFDKVLKETISLPKKPIDKEVVKEKKSNTNKN